MKIKSEKVVVEPEFTPIKLTITFESIDEAAQFYVVFNHTYIGDAIIQRNGKWKLGDMIREELSKQNKDIYHVQQEYHSRLCKVLQFKSYE